MGKDLINIAFKGSIQLKSVRLFMVSSGVHQEFQGVFPSQSLSHALVLGYEDVSSPRRPFVVVAASSPAVVNLLTLSPAIQWSFVSSI